MYLVTGGSGFLGQVVCEQLSSKGEQVIDFSLEATPSDRHINISGDIRSQSDLNVLFSTYPIHTVIHLASLLHTYSCSHPEEAFWTNTAGSVQLIDIARKHGVRRFLFGGTIDSIGEQLDIDGPVDEDVEARPGDFYSESKRIVEKVGAAYRSVYSFSFTAARIPVLVDPAQGQVRREGAAVRRVTQAQSLRFDGPLQMVQLSGGLNPDPDHPGTANAGEGTQSADGELEAGPAGGFRCHDLGQELQIGR